MEDIRKKEKKLSRDHWMCRVQKYTFGIDAPTYYMGYCPFFWVTWLSLLVCPVVFIVKTFIKLCSVPISPALTYFDKRANKRDEKLLQVPLKPSWREIIDIWHIFGDDDEKVAVSEWTLEFFSRNHIKAQRLRLWFIQNPDWRDSALKEAFTERERIMEEHNRMKAQREAQNVKRNARNRKLSNVASKCGRGIFKLLIPALILTAVSFAYIGLAKLVALITLQGLVGAFTILFAIVAGFFAVKIVIDALNTFVLADHVNLKIANFLEYIFGDYGLFFKTVDKFKSVFEFIKDTVFLTYKAECPLIMWGDETGKITKREKKM